MPMPISGTLVVRDAIPDLYRDVRSQGRRRSQTEARLGVEGDPSHFPALLLLLGYGRAMLGRVQGVVLGREPRKTTCSYVLFAAGPECGDRRSGRPLHAYPCYRARKCASRQDGMSSYVDGFLYLLATNKLVRQYVPLVTLGNTPMTDDDDYGERRG